MTDSPGRTLKKYAYFRRRVKKVKNMQPPDGVLASPIRAPLSASGWADCAAGGGGGNYHLYQKTPYEIVCN